ncbi:MAG: hypothetical protein EU530_01210 [Promethearchaeota archaeon]|nr:MAG: hypothetical protein EU530_01210 [Candidatus Lokiarchaeota archaeon]
MKNFKIIHLERLGKIRRNKVANFSHRYTQEEYESKLEEMHKDLTKIQKTLSDNLNHVQNQILGICIKKLEEVLYYYFNTRTSKQNLQKNRIFKKYITELRNFKKKYFGTNREVRDLIDETIENLVHQFINQRNYILELEEKIKNDNITPFVDTIEILDNSIKKIFLGEKQ